MGSKNADRKHKNANKTPITGKDPDGMSWVIQPHPPAKQEPPKPQVSKTHPCKMSGAFLLVGGYVKIYDEKVPSGQRGHELYLEFGGVGVGGMDTGGSLNINTSSWDEFYNKVKSFAYLSVSPLPEAASKKMAHTELVFYDSNHNVVGKAIPDVSFDMGLGGGTVSVKK